VPDSVSANWSCRFAAAAHRRFPGAGAAVRKCFVAVAHSFAAAAAHKYSDPQQVPACVRKCFVAVAHSFAAAAAHKYSAQQQIREHNCPWVREVPGKAEQQRIEQQQAPELHLT